ncbi:cbb3-type cytochrome c oxidase subunit I [Bacillus sp. REN10]|uniref:cbb3-type cytochrome c oxidase subunit I n=1 Tax=Bacillus sp. REN10 TaxID=2782541 RepID=UPI00193B14C8|nr:cbb3-type cytochrome c oxidase subunit I [Bacillus sp. REN10]
MAVKFIKIAVVYFALGVLLGYYMSIQHTYTLTGVHVHLLLLGWVAFMFAGIIYYLFPSLTFGKIAKAHYWLHNIGLPIMMIALTFLLATKDDSFTLWVALGSTLTTLGILLFVYNILANLKTVPK